MVSNLFKTCSFKCYKYLNFEFWTIRHLLSVRGPYVHVFGMGTQCMGRIEKGGLLGPTRGFGDLGRSVIYFQGSMEQAKSFGSLGSRDHNLHSIIHLVY